MAARMAIIDTTTISSMSVKPRERRGSPGVVGRSIQRLRGALRIDVPDVLAAPARALRLVLVAAQAPLPGPRHRVRRNPPQELQLAVGGGARPVHTLHRYLQVRRVALAAHLDVGAPDLSLVDRR